MTSVARFDEWQTTLGTKTGTVLQTVSVFDNTQYTFNTGAANQVTFYDIAGLQLTITPRSASSKILLMAHVTVAQTSDAYNIYLRFNRAGTPIASCNSINYTSGSSATVGHRMYMSGASITAIPMCFLDSPGTTSPTTYKIQVCNSGGSSYTSWINRANTTDTSWQQPGTSNLIAMEIQA